MSAQEIVRDVAIIGGGVVGCSLARELSRYRLRVVLIEAFAEVGFGTSKSNSGIVHAGHHSPANTLKGQLVVRGNQLIAELTRKLHFGFSRIGELVIAQSDEDLGVLEQLKRQGEDKGVPGLELWPRDRLQREEPNLSPSLVGALYAPSAAVINPYEFAFGLIENAVANGVTLLVDAPVQAIEAQDDALVLRTPRGAIRSRFVLNAAGLFADKIAEMAGAADFSIHPRKGEEYLLDKRLDGLVRHLIFPVPKKHTKGTLIIPTFDGTIMVGPTAQDTPDRHDVATTQQGASEVFHAVGRICPAITARDTIAEFAGLRAVSNSNDFVIRPSPVRGFIHVAGIQSPGLTAAPAIAEYICHILKEEGLALEPKEEFCPDLTPPQRFAAAGLEERQQLIARDARCARVVCRCELVTEAEVSDSIDRGARTLDGIKFRTRAGMGRCQGGFCTTRCMELLADKLGIDFAEVTKRGTGSWLVRSMRNAQHPDIPDGDHDHSKKAS